MGLEFFCSAYWEDSLAGAGGREEIRLRVSMRSNNSFRVNVTTYRPLDCSLQI